MRAVHAVLLGVTALVGSLHADTLSAQSKQSKTFGLIGGVALSTMNGDEAATDLTDHTGMMAGVSLVMSSAARMALEIDGLYVARGFKSTGTSSSFDLGVGYIEVPLLVRVQFARESTVKPFFSFGPSLGFKVNCSVSVTAAGASSSSSCDDLLGGSGPSISSTDFSGILGGGVEFNASLAAVTLGARYSRSFTSALDGQDNHFKVIGFYLGLAKGKGK